jgi:putative oxidoreductase
MAQSNLIQKWQQAAPQFKSILRIVAALMFMMSGTTKLFAFPGGMPKGMSLEIWSQAGIGAILEVVGGALLVVGLCTRPIAFILAGEMAVAFFQFHATTSYWPTVNGGVSAVLYCFIWLYFSSAGAGSWSVDAMRSKNTSKV